MSLAPLLSFPSLCPLPNMPSPRQASIDNHEYPPPRPPSPPSITYHPQILPQVIPTPSLIESVAGAAHYSGVKVNTESNAHHRRRSGTATEHHTDLKEGHERLMKDLIELYCCRPTTEIFQRSWRKDATFEDPFTVCQGYGQYAAQWFAMPNLFSKSRNISTRVMSSTYSPNRLIYYQIQEYTLRFIGHKKRVDSVIIVELDEDNKVAHLADQWQGQNPLWGCGSLVRRLSARATPWLVRVPNYPD